MSVPEEPVAEKTEEEKTDEEVQSAGRIVSAMVKAAKGVAIYPPGSSFHARFFGDLHKSIGGHLEEYGSLNLDIERYEMRFGTRTVYENRNPKDSLAFRIHADGITSLEFREGLTLDEIKSFLLILNSRSGEESDDDMATLLWSAELDHISYELEDDLEQVDSPLAGEPQEASAREEAITRVARAEPQPAAESPLRRETAKDILSLTEDEERFLAKAIAFEETKNPLDDLLEILPATLQAVETESFKGEILELTGSITSQLLADGLLVHVLALVKFLKKEAEGVGPSAENAAAALEGVAAAAGVESSEGFLKAAEKFDPAKIVTLLGLLGPGAAGPFCLLLGKPLGDEGERLLGDALVDAARSRSDVFLPHLAGNDTALAKKVLSILRLAGSPTAAGKLATLAVSGDASLQREVVTYIGELEISGGEQVLLTLMDSENSGIRIHAARTLASGGRPEAVDRIISSISSPHFRERGPAERRAFFEILGSTGSDQALAFLRECLAARHPFARKKEREEVLSAAAGLQKMGTVGAVEALRAEREGRKGELRKALDTILERIDRSTGAGGEEP